MLLVLVAWNHYYCSKNRCRAIADVWGC